MKLGFLTVLSAGFISIAANANAAPVTWNFQGHLTDVEGYTEYQAGDAFQVMLQFDTSAAEISHHPKRHELDPSSIAMNFKIGNTGWQQIVYSIDDGGLFFLRDNQANPDPSKTTLVDGLTFGLNNSQYAGGVNLIMRWNDLSALNGAQLPSLPPALLDMEANAFQGGDADSNFFVGTIDSVSAVPEPSTYASLALGLVALGAIARRKKQA